MTQNGKYQIYKIIELLLLAFGILIPTIAMWVTVKEDVAVIKTQVQQHSVSLEKLEKTIENMRDKR